MRPAFAAAALLLAAQPLAAAADPVGDFYRDHPMTLILGFNPGGGFDAYARVVVRHLPRHIPGEPSIVIKNMPGAGSLIAANHLFNNSPRDGSEIGFLSADMATMPLFGKIPARFDGRKFTWLGSVSSDAAYCVSWKGTPFTRIEDAFQNEMVVGAAGIEMSLTPTILREVLGIKFKLIRGYAGTAEVRLAAEKGEIQGWCNVGVLGAVGSHAEWLTDGTLRFLLQVGYAPRNEVPNVPFYLDYAKTDQDRQVLKVIFSYPYMARPFAAPPGIPADRAAALRRAFADTIQDPKFLADAKQAKLDVGLVTAEQIDHFLAEMYATPKPIVERAAHLLDLGEKK
jgi:tripartite-type tricarboxylate transporter receptor subunit TctC